jgi:hypothetical protein
MTLPAGMFTREHRTRSTPREPRGERSANGTFSLYAGRVRPVPLAGSRALAVRVWRDHI